MMCLACEQDAIWLAYLDSQGLLKPDDPAAVEALFSAFPVQPLPVQAEWDAPTPEAPADTGKAGRKPAANNPFSCDDPHGRMTDLTALTLAQARDALRKKEFSALELADAHLDRDGEGARAERVRAGNAGARPRYGARLGCATGERRGRSARRPAARHQGFVLHRRRAHHGLFAHPG